MQSKRHGKCTNLDRRWGIDVVLWVVRTCSWLGQQWQQQKLWWLQMNWTCQRAPQQEEKPTVRCVSTNVKPQLNAFTEDTHTHPPPHTHTTCTHTLLRISTHVRDPPEQIVFHSLNTRSATCLGISWVPKHIVTKHLTLKQTNKTKKKTNLVKQINGHWKIGLPPRTLFQ